MDVLQQKKQEWQMLLPQLITDNSACSIRATLDTAQQLLHITLVACFGNRYSILALHMLDQQYNTTLNCKSMSELVDHMEHQMMMMPPPPPPSASSQSSLPASLTTPAQSDALYSSSLSANEQLAQSHGVSLVANQHMVGSHASNLGQNEQLVQGHDSSLTAGEQMVQPHGSSLGASDHLVHSQGTTSLATTNQLIQSHGSTLTADDQLVRSQCASMTANGQLLESHGSSSLLTNEQLAQSHQPALLASGQQHLSQVAPSHSTLADHGQCLQLHSSSLLPQGHCLASQVSSLQGESNGWPPLSLQSSLTAHDTSVSSFSTAHGLSDAQSLPSHNHSIQSYTSLLATNMPSHSALLSLPPEPTLSSSLPIYSTLPSLSTNDQSLYTPASSLHTNGHSILTYTSSLLTNSSALHTHVPPLPMHNHLSTTHTEDNGVCSGVDEAWNNDVNLMFPPSAAYDNHYSDYNGACDVDDGGHDDDSLEPQQDITDLDAIGQQTHIPSLSEQQNMLSLNEHPSDLQSLDTSHSNMPPLTSNQSSLSLTGNPSDMSLLDRHHSDITSVADQQTDLAQLGLNALNMPAQEGNQAGDQMLSYNVNAVGLDTQNTAENLLSTDTLADQLLTSTAQTDVAKTDAKQTLPENAPVEDKPAQTKQKQKQSSNSKTIPCIACDKDFTTTNHDYYKHLLSDHVKREGKYAALKCTKCRKTFKCIWQYKQGHVMMPMTRYIRHMFSSHRACVRQYDSMVWCMADTRLALNPEKKGVKAISPTKTKLNSHSVTKKAKSKGKKGNSSSDGNESKQESSPTEEEVDGDVKKETKETVMKLGDFVCFLCDATMNAVTHTKCWKELKSHVQSVHVEEDTSSYWIQCPVCSQVFSHSRSRGYIDITMLMKKGLDHMHAHHSYTIPSLVDSYKCTDCDFTTVDKKLLRRHIQSVHTSVSDRQTKCELCGKIVCKDYKANHLAHFCPGVPDKPTHSCNMCNKVYTTICGLNKHITIVHNKRRPFLCPICGIPFARGHTFEVHMFRVHNMNDNGREVAKCPECNFETLAGSEMSNHIRKQHYKGCFPCPHCMQVFDLKKKLIHHVYHKHKVRRMYNCEYCVYTTRRKRLFIQHVAVRHYGIKLKCDQCKYKAATEKQLEEHVEAKHTSQDKKKQQEDNKKLTFSCTVCDMTFCTKHRMLTHLFAKHGINNTGKEVIQCSLCDYQVIDASMLRKHMKSKHENGNFSCVKCGKVFNCGAKLKSHMQRVHPSDKSKQCPHCSYVTDLASHLKLHMARKHDGRRLRCPLCKYYSFYEHCFKRHMSKVHQIDDLSTLPEVQLPSLQEPSQALPQAVPASQMDMASHLPYSLNTTLTSENMMNDHMAGNYLPPQPSQSLPHSMMASSGTSLIPDDVQLGPAPPSLVAPSLVPAPPSVPALVPPAAQSASVLPPSTVPSYYSSELSSFSLALSQSQARTDYSFQSDSQTHY